MMAVPIDKKNTECIFSDIDSLNRYYKEKTEVAYAEFVEKSVLQDIVPSFVFGDGTGSEQVVLLGEAPGKDEVKEGRPFVGAAGKILNDLLMRSGIRRENLYITNTVKYRLARYGSRPGTFANRPVKSIEIDMCSSWLSDELAYIKPKLLLTLGNTALKGALKCVTFREDIPVNIGESHGRMFEAELKLSGWEMIIIPLYHPASLIYNRALRTQYETDLEEVKKCVLSIL